MKEDENKLEYNSQKLSKNEIYNDVDGYTFDFCCLWKSNLIKKDNKEKEEEYFYFKIDDNIAKQELYIKFKA